MTITVSMGLVRDIMAFDVAATEGVKQLFYVQ